MGGGAKSGGIPLNEITVAHGVAFVVVRLLFPCCHGAARATLESPKWICSVGALPHRIRASDDVKVVPWSREGTSTSLPVASYF